MALSLNWGYNHGMFIYVILFSYDHGSLVTGHLLCHESHIGASAHGLRIEGAVLLAKFDALLGKKRLNVVVISSDSMISMDETMVF